MTARIVTDIAAGEIYAIGIDVGGTKIAAGLVALATGKILAKETIPTLPGRGGEAVLRDTVSIARRLMDYANSHSYKVQGIGVGIAELVDTAGVITSDHLIKWRDLNAQQVLSQIAPTRLESDARAPAAAEAHFGASRAFKTFIYLTIGTGISYCLVLEGKPYAGANGNALIAGSGILTNTCQHCGVASETSLEEFAAGPALVARYNQRVRANGVRNRQRPTGRAVAAGQEVTAAAAAGDTDAEFVVRTAGEALGNTAGFLINALDPEAVIVAGGLGLAGGLYWSSFVESTRRRIWSEGSRELPIVPAQLGLDAGLIGAALIAPAARR